MPHAVIVRHGATALNDSGALRGWLDPPLSAAGEEQARALKLPPLPSFSSDLSRALCTAALAGFRPRLRRALRPWDVGSFAGAPAAVAHPRLAEYALEQPGLPVPFGESWDSFTARLLGFVRSLREDCVLFTHYRCCRALLALRDGRIDAAAVFELGSTACAEVVEVDL